MNQVCTILLLSVLLSCKKKSIPEPIKSSNNSEKITESFKQIWSTKSSYFLYCRGTFSYDGGVVFFVSENKKNARDQIVSLDKFTGDTLWVWDQNPMYTAHRFIKDNILYFSGGTSIYGVDCKTGKTLWESKPDENEAHLSLSITDLGNFVAYQKRDVLDKTNNLTTLYRIDNHGHKHKIYEIRAADRNGFTFNFEHMTPWHNHNGDLILIAESRSWNYGELNKGKGEYLAINLSTDSIYADWSAIFNDIDIGGKSTIVNDVLYLHSGWDKLAAIDLNTRKVLWKRKISREICTASIIPLMAMNDKLLIGSGNRGYLNVFRQNDGMNLLSMQDIGTDWFSTNFIEYNKHIYFITSMGLFQITDSGTIVRHTENKETTAHNGGSFTQGLAIDQKTGALFTTRGNHFVCLAAR